MRIELYLHDIPDALRFGDSVAVDTETMGLDPYRDRLCLVQLCGGDDVCHLVHFPDAAFEAPNLRRLLVDPKTVKLFHFARFDLAVLKYSLGVVCQPVYCTKTASRLARTFTDRHSLKDLCRELLGVELSKLEQSSDWGAPTLSEAQMKYAATDVLYLHRIAAILDTMLLREGRRDLAAACFAFLPTRAELDLKGWGQCDIFAH
jgi:ribonuclease D